MPWYGIIFALVGALLFLCGGCLLLARMFLRHADLLVLDEPTASLDAQAEYELYQQFRQLMHGHTCLLITHRFSTVRMADNIAVLENSQITEYGTHTELLARQQTYARLYCMQAESYTEQHLSPQTSDVTN